MRKIFAGAAMVAAVALTPANAGENATAREVIEKVRDAAAMLARDGERGIATIADPASPFMWKDTYVFVVDCEADRVLANPAFPKRVGGDIKQHTDYSGYRYGPVLCETAMRANGGWIEYQWAPAGGDTGQRKVSYVVSVPGRPYQVGAGIYNAQRSLEELSDLTNSEARR